MNMSISYIYGIGTSGNTQKIGMSKNPANRLKSLQTSNSEKLILHYRFAVPSTMARKEEMLIHRDFAHKRLKGEWFIMSADEVISSLKWHEMMLEDNMQKMGYFGDFIFT